MRNYSLITLKHYYATFKALLLIALLLVSFAPLKVFAIDTQFYSRNGILYYNPDVTCTVSPTTAATSSNGGATVVQSDTLKQIFQLLLGDGFNAVQAAAIMGNMKRESEFNPDAHEIGNDIGYGLVQWSFGRRTALEQYAAQQNVAVSDLSMQVSYIKIEYNSTYKSRLDATPFKDATDVTAATRAWMEVYEAPKLVPENDPATLNSIRVPAAVAIYGFYKDLAPSSTTTTSGCNVTANGAVAQKIIQTALKYALPVPATDTMKAQTDATPAYQTAKQQYNPSVDWTDCGGFIATVMISSGADTSYPLVNVATQLAYVQAHPEKYKIISSPTETDLQPGDILISASASHTSVYIGEQHYTDIDASLGQRVPSVRDSSSHVWMLQNGAVIARLLK